MVKNIRISLWFVVPANDLGTSGYALNFIFRNFLPMLVWAVIIVIMTVLGIATGFLGLIVTFPVIGLASWRAYRDLVPSSAGDVAAV